MYKQLRKKVSHTAVTTLLVFSVSMMSVLSVNAQVMVSSWGLRYVEPLVEAFNAKNTGVRAEAVALSPDALKTRLITDLAPDIIMLHVGHFDYEWEDNWLDLTQIIDRTKSDDDWLPGTWEAVTIPHGDFAGQYRRVKNTYEVPVFYYDKVKMAEAGLPEPADLHREGRWTWDDMLSTAQKLTRDLDGDGQIDEWGISHDVGFGWKNSGYYEIWGLQAGEYIVSSDGHYTANRPAFVDMLQWWADLYLVHRVSPAPRPGISLLPGGTAAMTIYGTHAHFNDQWEQFPRWDMAPLPNMPENRPYNYVYEHGAWVVNKNTKHMEDTLKFVEFLLTPEAVEIMSRDVGFFPVRKSVIREFSDYQTERFPWAENIAYTILSTVEQSMLPTKPGPWYIPGWNDVRAHINSAVISTQMGEVPAAIALQQVAGPIQAILNEGRDRMIPGTLEQ